MAWRASARIDFVSRRSLSMSVLLPSSTEPHVRKRRRPSAGEAILEVTLLLPLLHGGVGGLVVEPRRAALGDRGRGGLRDDLLEGAGGGLDRRRAGDVADGPEPDGHLLDRVSGPSQRDVGHGDEGPGAADDGAAVREVDGGERSEEHTSELQSRENLV